MPNSLTAAGLQTSTYDELVTNYNTAMQAIYGADINLDSDSPDGEWIGNMSQQAIDILDLVAQVYSSMDPDQAIGVSLDQRVSYNGIQRMGGTFTITPITLTLTQSVNLYGLDQSTQLPYTVADNAGNQWVLQTTEVGVGPGTVVYNFQAAVPGAQLTVPNTIQTPVTIVLGVSSINNPTSYTSLGVNQESDALLRLRRQRSVSLPSQGYFQSLLGALENIPGVTSAFVYENDASATDSDGVPGHSIWVIVAGSGAAAIIANTIYIYRNAGCGMFGSQSFTITQVDGSPFIIEWDDVQTINLFIAFTATSINGVNPPNVGAIRTQLPILFMPSVFQEVNINGLSTIVQEIDSNTLVTHAGFSTGQTQILTLSGVAASGTFGLNYNGAVTSINWNDSISTIQTKVQGITGLSAALVTGSIASQTLTFNLTAVGNIQALLYVVSNTLMTSVPAAITFTYNEGYTNTLSPSSKKYQFVISSPNIVIIPLLLLPATSTVIRSNTLQFAAYGGYGVLVFSLAVNNSGGSINSSSGLYTAGSMGNVTDTVQVVDVFGNFTQATVTVG